MASAVVLHQSVRLRLYSRSGCHLCDKMLQELETLQREIGAGMFSVEVLDIDQNPETQRKYSLRIPVLAGAGEQILCESRLHRQSVLEYLAAVQR